MQTFIVRIVDADDIDGLAGFIEEPARGYRQRFDGASSLVEAIRGLRARVPIVVAESEPPDEPESDGRSQVTSSNRRS